MEVCLVDHQRQPIRTSSTIPTKSSILAVRATLHIWDLLRVFRHHLGRHFVLF